MADAAIEEQLEVQTAFREHGARLQGIYDKRQRTEMDIARKEQEIKQLKGERAAMQLRPTPLRQKLLHPGGRAAGCSTPQEPTRPFRMWRCRLLFAAQLLYAQQ